jgi:ketosteroid isomerase-like protein
MMNRILFLLLIFLLSGCETKSKQVEQMNLARREIYNTEKAFEKMVAEKGLAEAFSYYVADSGIVSRRDSLLQGRDAIHKFYEGRSDPTVSLKWTPDFIDVSSSCDLGYTYGKYTYSVTDSAGKVTESRGYFHTVWKKQPDGNWRFVWD